MTRKLLMTTLVVATSVALLTGTAFADNDIKDEWLGIYVDVCPELITAANTCVLCHTTIPTLNPYGGDYSGDWVAIEGTDSDGDTVNNGQEIIVDCTLPGDPTSVTPNDDLTWGAIKALYN